MSLERLTLIELSAGLAKKEFSSREVTDACLAVAEKNAGTTHAYIEIRSADARAAADSADARRAKGESLSALDGAPIAIKDNLLLTGVRATAGSAILSNYIAPYDATAVARLRSAGAVFVGKANMDEFAMGSSTESSAYGVTRNPWDLERIPGGSSGGSAVAVAEGSAIASLGSDTGGSIRQPAAMCGVVGIKPTYGRVSRHGLMAMASSLDQVGTFARTVQDASMLLGAIEGGDVMDSTSVDLKADQALPKIWPESLKGVRIGLPKEYFVSGMHPEVERETRLAIKKLEELGAEIREVSLPNAKHALAVYYILMPSEVSANLARFDGIRYGARAKGETLEETYRNTRGAGFGPEVRRRIMLGTHTLSSGYYDAYYHKALKVRRLIAEDFTKVFEEVDVLVTPTTPATAWKLGEKSSDPLEMYLADVYTVSVNVAGLPAVSVPCGFASGMPVGLQIIGRHFDEKTMLGVAHAYERAVDLRAKLIPHN